MKAAERLKQMRESAGLTQAQVAKIIHTSQQYYGKYENGERSMPMERYMVLAEYYNISLDYLTGMSDVPRKLK